MEGHVQRFQESLVFRTSHRHLIFSRARNTGCSISALKHEHTQHNYNISSVVIIKTAFCSSSCCFPNSQLQVPSTQNDRAPEKAIKEDSSRESAPYCRISRLSMQCYALTPSYMTG